MKQLLATYGARIGIVILLHVASLCITWFWGNPFMPDSYDYLIQAEHIRESGDVYARDYHLSYDPDYVSRRPPLYALFIAAIQWISPSVFYVLLAQHILSIITFSFLLIVCQRLLGMQVSNRRFLFLWLLLPLQLLFAGKIMSELLFEVSLTCSVLCLLLWYRKQKMSYFLVSQLWLIAAVFTKPALSLYWPVSLLLAAVLLIKFRKTYLLFCSFLFPLAIGAWSYFNYTKTGYYHFSSITHVNLVDYNLKYFLQHKYGEAHTDKVIQQIHSQVKLKGSYAQRCSYLKDTAVSILKQSPFDYLVFHARGIIPFFADGGRYEYATYFNAQGSEGLLKIFSSKPSEIPSLLWRQDIKVLVLFVITALGALIMLFYLLKFLFSRRFVFLEKLFVLLPVVYLAAVTGPLGSARFRFPVLLLMALMFLAGGKKKKR